MAEKEYIERGVLLEQLNKKKAETGKMRYTEGFNDAIMRVRSMVNSASTADVAPVVHGEWDEIPNVYMSVASKNGSHSSSATSRRKPSTPIFIYLSQTPPSAQKKSRPAFLC